MNRRKFLEAAGILIGGSILSGCAQRETVMPEAQSSGDGKVYVGKDADPARAVIAAITAAGGLKSVVKPGTHVLLKPNAAWARTPEQAATTNPAVVAAMVKLCKEAGASRVTVFEHTIDKPSRMVLGITGIGKAASEAGADVVTASSPSDFTALKIEKGKLLKTDTIANAVSEADVIINMPKAKYHSQTELTLGLKNLMGINWDRPAWHEGPDLHQYIADYATAIPVSLTVMDATRVLLTNGPKGPGETKDPQEVIVSFDRVAADAYATGLFGLKPYDVAYIVKAAEIGLGAADLSKIKVVRA